MVTTAERATGVQAVSAGRSSLELLMQFALFFASSSCADGFAALESARKPRTIAHMLVR